MHAPLIFLAMMIYSLVGAMLSFAAMLISKRIKLFSVTGVSVIGGVFHNLGQIIVAIFVLATASLIYYFPFLVVVGTVSGIVIGVISGMIIERFKKNNFGF